jgi:hypothetical protein
MPDSQCASTELPLAFRPIVPYASRFNPKALIALAQEAKDEVTRSTLANLAYEAGVRQVSLQNRYIVQRATTVAIQAMQVVQGLPPGKREAG